VIAGMGRMVGLGQMGGWDVSYSHLSHMSPYVLSISFYPIRPIAGTIRQMINAPLGRDDTLFADIRSIPG
jgi:hypothetical protein